MNEYDIFVVFDLGETNALYNKFYEETEKIGFTKYIPANYTLEKNEISLPNPTIFSRKIDNDIRMLRDDIRSEIKNIYQAIGAKGKFIVIISESWGSNEV